MWDRREVKECGKYCFKKNYWRSVLAALLISVLTGASAASGSFNGNDSDTGGDDSAVNGAAEALNDISGGDQGIALAVGAAVIGVFMAAFIVHFILKIFVFNPLQVGCYGFFKENAGGYDPDLSILKTGFTRYGHTFITLFLRDLFTMLWALLFIVPGFIKAYSYRMVPFILRDHPEMTAREVITESRRLMDGHKWNVFLFDLSYIGWFLLGMITLGLVNVFWTGPYRQNANAAIYLSLIAEEQPIQAEVIPLAQ